METLTVKGVGPIKEAVDIKFNKITVFSGKECSGKSTIAKIFNFCLLVEEDTVTSQDLSKYQGSYFKTRLEKFYGLQGYLRPDSYINYHSDSVNICWENGECKISLVNRDLYRCSRMSYIPSDRNIVALTETRKIELGDTCSRRLLFDWFNARQVYTEESKLPILNLGLEYYYIEGSYEENFISGSGFNIPLSGSSGSLKILTPLVVITEYLYKTDKDDITSYDWESRKRDILNSFIENTLKSQSMSDIESTLDRSSSRITIEDPELGISSETQKTLVLFILSRYEQSSDNSLVITTNSIDIIESITHECSIYDVRDGIVYPRS